MAIAAATPAVSQIAAVVATSPAPAVALQVGQVVDALVLKLIGSTGAQLAVANTVIDVSTTIPLTPGAPLRLAVERDATGFKLVVQPPVLQNGVAPQASTDARRDSKSVQAGAAGGAAPSQRSGEFVSGDIATGEIAKGESANVANVSRPGPPSSPAAVVSPQQAALNQTVGRAAAQQDSLAPLFANAAVAAVDDTLPPDVKDTVLRVLGLRSALSEDISSQDIKTGLSRSGLFLEARLAVVATAGEAGVRAALPDDLKAALLSLREVLSGLLASAGERDAASADVSPKAGPPVADDAAAVATRAAPVAPPYRGATPSAQPVATAIVAPGELDADAVRILLDQTDAGIARQTLMQAASLPTAGQSDRSNAPLGSNWAFEIPFVTQQGTAMAQFEVSREGRHDAADAAKATWRARFSIDIEPIGPVHAQIAIAGVRTAVTLWAERSDSATALRDNASLLTEGLRSVELEQGDVSVRDGRPPLSRAPAGHFLDRAS